MQLSAFCPWSRCLLRRFQASPIERAPPWSCLSLPFALCPAWPGLSSCWPIVSLFEYGACSCGVLETGVCGWLGRVCRDGVCGGCDATRARMAVPCVSRLFCAERVRDVRKLDGRTWDDGRPFSSVWLVCPSPRKPTRSWVRGLSKGTNGDSVSSRGLSSDGGTDSI